MFAACRRKFNQKSFLPRRKGEEVLFPFYSHLTFFECCICLVCEVESFLSWCFFFSLSFACFKLWLLLLVSLRSDSMVFGNLGLVPSLA